MASIFESDLVLEGPWRKPAQMLAEQEVAGRASIHDEGMAKQVGFQGAAIEGPTHFSQLDPLGYRLYGDAWFEQGCVSSHYLSPCVEGDEVQAWATLPAPGGRHTRAGLRKKDGTPVLSATLSVGPSPPPTELDLLLAKIRPADTLVILADIQVGQKGAEIERVRMNSDQHMGKLYPFTLEQKLARITEPCRWYTAEGAGDSPWGRPIIPIEMISVLAQYTSGKARFPVRQPSVGLFANQEIRLLAGPLFVGEDYLVEREVVALSESRRAESMWVRSTIRTAKTEEPVATMLLNSASMKASYPKYEEERAAAESA